LKGSPYLLTRDLEVVVRIISVNIYGDSDPSIDGNGAIIQDKPDAPINLVNVVAITSSTKIGISWEEGPSNGGTPV